MNTYFQIRARRLLPAPGSIPVRKRSESSASGRACERHFAAGTCVSAPRRWSSLVFELHIAPACPEPRPRDAPRGAPAPQRLPAPPQAHRVKAGKEIYFLEHKGKGFGGSPARVVSTERSGTFLRKWGVGGIRALEQSADNWKPAPEDGVSPALRKGHSEKHLPCGSRNS